MRRAWSTRLAGAALAVSALLGAAHADAGNVTVTKTTAATNDTLRQKTYLYNISYQDCLDDIEFTFAVGVTGSTTGFQVWASESTDCKTSLNRTDTKGGCKRLVSSYPASTGKVVLKARQILAALAEIDEKTCVDSTGSSAARQVNLYFMITGSSETVPDEDAYVWDQTQIDLVGPEPPSGSELSLDPADGSFILTLPANTDADKLGYYIFCDPNPDPPAGSIDECSASDAGTGGTGGSGGMGGGGAGGAGGTGGAGGGTDAGTTDAGTTDAGTTDAGTGGSAGTGGTAGAGGAGGESSGETACPAGTTLGCVDTKHPSTKSSSVCGSRIAASATAPVISGLTNDVPYVVAIAAYDQVNNIGPLSVLQCGTPQPTRTFFNQYCADGGVACADGCGTCTVGVGRELAWPGLGAIALAAAAFAVRRDERRRKKARRENGNRVESA